MARLDVWYGMAGKRSRIQVAIVKRNALIDGLSGSLGKSLYVRQMRDGRTIISMKPDFSTRKCSEAQIEHQKRVKRAGKYGKEACKQNPIYARLAEGTHKSAFNIAFADYMKPPVIHSLELQQNNSIRVNATDNVQVTRVVITVLDGQGHELEQGDASLELDNWWKYQPTHQGHIRVEAWDMAGNAVQKEFDDPWM